MGMMDTADLFRVISTVILLSGSGVLFLSSWSLRQLGRLPRGRMMIMTGFVFAALAAWNIWTVAGLEPAIPPTFGRLALWWVYFTVIWNARQAVRGALTTSRTAIHAQRTLENA